MPLLASQPAYSLAVRSEEGFVFRWLNATAVKDQDKAQSIVDFFWYAIHDGQSKAVDMTYAPLSSGVQQRAEQAIGTITFNGQVLHPVSK